MNKYLDNRKLLPINNHSFYSLRHTFEDRLTAVDAPEKVIAALLGHKSQRPKYGSGPDLAQKQRWMQQIALPHRRMSDLLQALPQDALGPIAR